MVWFEWVWDETIWCDDYNRLKNILMDDIMWLLFYPW